MNPAPPTTFPPLIITQQLFSRRGIGYLYDHRSELDPGQVTIINSMYNNRKKGTLECQQTITYKLSSSKAGKLGWGRYYGSKGGLETVEKECRGTLCKEFYYDLDIVNCHFVLLAQFAKKLYNKDMPEVERYIDNREEFLRTAGGSRDDAKMEIIKILYGGTTTNEFLLPLSKETRAFSKYLSTLPQYAELFKAVKHEDNVYGTFLSYILQTEERKCMLAMKGSLERQGWSVDVLCYDGVMIRKKDGDLFFVMRRTEDEVAAETGYKVSITSKEMSSFEIPALTDEMAKGVTREAYEAMKVQFEENHFYYIPTNEIVEVHNRELTRMTLPHAYAHLTAKWRFKRSTKFDDYLPFLELGKDDPTRRSVRMIDMKPSDDPEVFVISPQFAWTKQETSRPEAVAKFQELITLFGSETQQKYITNWLAQLIQKPFDKQGTALVITGSKGTGKDTPFDFFMDYVIGESYANNYTCGGKQFFNTHDAGRKNRFLCKIEEANHMLFRQNADQFKSLITARNETFNEKCVKPIVMGNYNRFVLTTNGGCPVEMTGGERRFVVSRCSDAKKNDHSYWSEVRNTLFNKEAGRAVGEWLSTLDISEFNFREIPQDDYQNAITESVESSEENFIEQWDGQPLGASEFFQAYRQYCVSNDFPYAMNVKQLGFRLLPLIRDMKVVKKRTSTGFLYQKPGI